MGKLVVFHELNGTHERDLQYARRILAYDDTREKVHRLMMRLYWLSGDRGAALAQYKLCVQILQDSLGVAPMAETSQLISAPVKPAWLTLADSGNGAATLSGVASGQTLGDYPVELQVVDGLGLSATQSFTVTIVSATRSESGQHSDESARRAVLTWPGEPSLAGVTSREQLPGNRRERASAW